MYFLNLKVIGEKYKMKILAIDTSSKICSVAITEDDKKIIELHSDDDKTHSVKLMPMVDDAFKSTNLTLNKIDLLVCSVGPGSFTTGGHFIVLAGLKDGKIIINDPNSIENSKKLWDLDEFQDEISNMWSYSLEE